MFCRVTITYGGKATVYEYPIFISTTDSFVKGGFVESLGWAISS